MIFCFMLNKGFSTPLQILKLFENLTFWFTDIHAEPSTPYMLGKSVEISKYIASADISSLWPSYVSSSVSEKRQGNQCIKASRKFPKHKEKIVIEVESRDEPTRSTKDIYRNGFFKRKNVQKSTKMQQTIRTIVQGINKEV